MYTFDGYLHIQKPIDEAAHFLYYDVCNINEKPCLFDDWYKLGRINRSDGSVIHPHQRFGIEKFTCFDFIYGLIEHHKTLVGQFVF